jgi:tetratricopeptide (TPR) repeat protein
MANDADLNEPPEVRTGAGMQYGGWDGYSKATHGSPFIPKGDACWEMSKRRDIAAKAEEDYRARTTGTEPALAAQTTLVLVTLRRWSKKASWRDEKRRENVWHDVRFYDADDLYLWLQQHPTTHRELTRRTYGVFEGISTQTRPTRQDNLPLPLKDFVGRQQQIGEFMAAFDAAMPDVTFSCIISGLPGAGKTSLALAFATRLDDAFPDGRLFFDLRGTQDDFLDATTVQLAALRAIGEFDSVPDNAETIDTAYRTSFSSRRILLVLDNARDEAQVRPLLVGSQGSVVLLTSRNKLLGLDPSLFIRLDVFEEDNSVELLSKLCASRNFDDSVGRKVADLCGNLPLAVRIAGVLAAQTPGWGLAHLAGQLEDESTRLTNLEAGDRAVRASFQLSYRLLPSATRRCFALCSTIPGPHWDDELASIAIGWKLKETREQLRILSERNLIQYSELPGEYRFHDLLRTFSYGSDLGKDGDNLRVQAKTRVVSHLIETAIGHGTALSSVELANSLAKGEIASREQQAALRYLDLRIENVSKAVLPLDYMRSSQAILMLVSALEPYFRLRPITPEAVLMADAGIRAASACRKQALEQKADSETVRRAGSWMALMLLLQCDVLSRAGQSNEAMKSLEKAKKLARSLNDANLIVSAFTAAGQFAHRQGDNQSALAEYAAASEMSALIADDKLRSIIGYNMGNMLRQTGDPSKSLTFLESDLSVCLRGGDMLGEATVRNALGVVLTKLNRPTEAILHLRKAVHIYSEFEDIQSASDAHFDLGTALLAAGEYTEGITHLEQDAAYCRALGNQLGAEITEVALISARVQHSPETAGDNAMALAKPLVAIRASGNPIQIATALADAAKVQFAAGLVEAGMRSALEASELFERGGGRWQQASVLIWTVSQCLELSTMSRHGDDLVLDSVKAISMLKSAKAALANERTSDLFGLAESLLAICENVVNDSR